MTPVFSYSKNIFQGMFYAVGGRNNLGGSSDESDWVEAYNPVRDQWRPCSPMSVRRNRVGVAVMDGLLYAVGGSAGKDYHNSVEWLVKFIKYAPKILLHLVMRVRFL